MPLASVFAGEDIVVVMGPTGSGKSTFIARATGQSDGAVNHGLQSDTADIQTIRVTHPTGGHPVVFVDTPGFDDTYSSDTDILSQIADWLVQTHKENVAFASIIYLHRISDNRMGGSLLKNLQTFASLCGQKAMKNVVIVTTMWSEVKKESGIRREQELKRDFWKVMLADGCKTERFDNTSESAWRIVGKNVPTTLLLPEEMSGVGKSFIQTSAYDAAVKKGLPKWLAAFWKRAVNIIVDETNQKALDDKKTADEKIKAEETKAQALRTEQTRKTLEQQNSLEEKRKAEEAGRKVQEVLKATEKQRAKDLPTDKEALAKLPGVKQTDKAEKESPKAKTEETRRTEESRLADLETKKRKAEEEKRREEDKRTAEIEAKRLEEEAKERALQARRVQDEKKAAEFEAQRQAEELRKEKERLRIQMSREAEIKASSLEAETKKRKAEEEKRREEVKRTAEIEAKRLEEEAKERALQAKRVEDEKKAAEFEAQRQAEERRKERLRIQMSREAEIKASILEAETKKLEEQKRAAAQRAAEMEVQRVAQEKALEDLLVNQRRCAEELEKKALEEKRDEENRQTKESRSELNKRADDKAMEQTPRKEGTTKSEIISTTKGHWQLFANPKNSQHATDFVMLVNLARQSFASIELWQKQKHFDNPLVTVILDKIAKQILGYYEAIHKSTETAQKGCSFAKGAVDFCKRLFRAEDSLETLKSGLVDIKEVAKNTHQDSEQTHKQFKIFRTELVNILKDLPSDAVSRQRDKDALTPLHRSMVSLDSLIQHLGSFVNWWNDMHTSLANLEEILPQARINGTNPFRTKVVAERWIQVHEKYVWYQREMGAVDEYYRKVMESMRKTREEPRKEEIKATPIVEPCSKDPPKGSTEDSQRKEPYKERREVIEIEAKTRTDEGKRQALEEAMTALDVAKSALEQAKRALEMALLNYPSP